MLGYVDEVILLPVLIWLTLRLLPASVVEESRQKAEQWMAQQSTKPRSFGGAVLVVATWLALGLALLWWLKSAFAQ